MNCSHTVRDGLNIVSLSGSWHDMGVQYGSLLHDNLLNVYQFMLDKLQGQAKRHIAAAEIANKLYNATPQCHREYLDGIAQGAGLPHDVVRMVNAVEYAEGCFFCSALAVWGSHSNSGLIYGRNYDGVSFAPLAGDVALTIYHPADGAMPFATIGYIGEAYATTGINAGGLFVELNNGMPTVGFDYDWSVVPATSHLMTLLGHCRTLDEGAALLTKEQASAGFLIGMADANEARCYEWCPQGIRRGAEEPGRLVITNHYTNPDWQYALPTDSGSWNSLSRRRNIINLADAAPQPIEIDTVCRIMQTPMAEGGPRHGLTLYQVVAHPATGKLRCRITSNETWATIDMAELW